MFNIRKYLFYLLLAFMLFPYQVRAQDIDALAAQRAAASLQHELEQAELSMEDALEMLEGAQEYCAESPNDPDCQPGGALEEYTKQYNEALEKKNQIEQNYDEEFNKLKDQHKQQLEKQQREEEERKKQEEEERKKQEEYKNSPEGKEEQRIKDKFDEAYNLLKEKYAESVEGNPQYDASLYATNKAKGAIESCLMSGDYDEACLDRELRKMGIDPETMSSEPEDEETPPEEPEEDEEEETPPPAPEEPEEEEEEDTPPPANNNNGNNGNNNQPPSNNNNNGNNGNNGNNNPPPSNNNPPEDNTINVKPLTQYSGDTGIFADIIAAGREIFHGLRTLIFAISGFGIIGVAIGGIFGKMNWKWLSAIIISLVVISLTGGLIQALTGDENLAKSLVTDTLQ